MAAGNRTLGNFRLVGIPPAPRGTPQIEVTFDIDANGIVNVSAKDLGTGREQKITITSSSGLSKEEIDKMMKDATAHGEEDKKRRQEVETQNRAEIMVYETEKMLKENQEKISEEDRGRIQGAIDDTRKAIESGSAEAIQKATEQLTEASHKVAATMYQEAAASRQQAAAAGGGAAEPPPAGGDAGTGAGDKDVIDAEYVDVDEDKK